MGYMVGEGRGKRKGEKKEEGKDKGEWERGGKAREEGADSLSLSLGRDTLTDEGFLGTQSLIPAIRSACLVT